MKFTNKTTKTFISSIPSFRQIKNENENESKDNWTIEWENGKQIQHSNVLFGKEDETKRNEWWMIERKTLNQWSSSESTKSFKWRIDNFDDCKNCYNDNKKNLKDLIHNNYISIDSIFIHLFVFLFDLLWLISWKRNEMKQNEIKRKDIKNESIRMNNDQITFFLIKSTLFSIFSSQLNHVTFAEVHDKMKQICWVKRMFLNKFCRISKNRTQNCRSF